MSFDLASITKGAQIRAPRMIILGVPKIGKSQFASGSDSPIFLPIKGEEGIDAIDVPRFPTANSFDDVLTALGTLYTDEHEFGTVVIDSASALEPLIFDAVCAAHGVKSIEEVLKGFGKGYMEALHQWRQLTEALDALRSHKGMASIIIGHVKVKTFNDPLNESYDRYQFDVNDKAAALLNRWSDATVFANKRTSIKKEEKDFSKKERNRAIDLTGKHYLYTRETPAHPGGGRGVYGQLPYELPLEWEAYKNAVAEAAKSTTK